MDSKQKRSTRRALLARAPAALACLAALPLAVAGRQAAAAKLEKDDVQYRDKPKDGRRCADCSAYLPSSMGGTCRVVEGQISPDGWCAAYSPKS